MLRVQSLGLECTVLAVNICLRFSSSALQNETKAESFQFPEIEFSSIHLDHNILGLLNVELWLLAKLISPAEENSRVDHDH